METKYIDIKLNLSYVILNVRTLIKINNNDDDDDKISNK